MHNPMIVQLTHAGQQLGGEATHQRLRQAARELHQRLERALGAELHKDEQLLAMHFDAIVAHQILVLNALENLQLLGDILQRTRLARLYGNLLHGHQLARIVVHSRVHLAKASLANLDATMPAKVDAARSNLHLVAGVQRLDLANEPAIAQTLLQVEIQSIDSITHALLSQRQRALAAFAASGRGIYGRRLWHQQTQLTIGAGQRRLQHIVSAVDARVNARVGVLLLQTELRMQQFVVLRRLQQRRCIGIQHDAAAAAARRHGRARGRARATGGRRGGLACARRGLFARHLLRLRGNAHHMRNAAIHLLLQLLKLLVIQMLCDLQITGEHQELQALAGPARAHATPTLAALHDEVHPHFGKRNDAQRQIHRMRAVLVIHNALLEQPYDILVILEPKLVALMQNLTRAREHRQAILLVQLLHVALAAALLHALDNLGQLVAHLEHILLQQLERRLDVRAYEVMLLIGHIVLVVLAMKVGGLHIAAESLGKEQNLDGALALRGEQRLRLTANGQQLPLELLVVVVLRRASDLLVQLLRALHQARRNAAQQLANDAAELLGRQRMHALDHGTDELCEHPLLLQHGLLIRLGHRHQHQLIDVVQVQLKRLAHCRVVLIEYVNIAAQLGLVLGQRRRHVPLIALAMRQRQRQALAQLLHQLAQTQRIGTHRARLQAHAQKLVHKLQWNAAEKDKRGYIRGQRDRLRLLAPVAIGAQLNDLLATYLRIHRSGCAIFIQRLCIQLKVLQLFSARTLQRYVRLVQRHIVQLMQKRQRLGQPTTLEHVLDKLAIQPGGLFAIAVVAGAAQRLHAEYIDVMHGILAHLSLG
ncbi:maker158 [Drosophila busckii]|uniref:Maker158 n=1 Tax=Drosophila busckii TaxID=30019 RepID=A0A0M4EM27_DROBS|nr:maker158 [Drosophila busckii]